MKLLTKLIIVGSMFISGTAAATCTSYECKKKATLADKAISEPVRKELTEYYEKSDKLFHENKDKRAALRNSLSEDAKKALAKHHKRRNYKVTKAPEDRV